MSDRLRHTPDLPAHLVGAEAPMACKYGPLRQVPRVRHVPARSVRANVRDVRRRDGNR
jgi:hypothetical protein